MPVNFKTHHFSNRNGFPIHLEYRNKNGLEKKAETFRTIQSGKLYLIFYAAPSLSFFDCNIGRIRKRPGARHVKQVLLLDVPLPKSVNVGKFSRVTG